MDADARPVVEVESWKEMDELRKEVRRHRRRLAADLLSLKFVWQREKHPHTGQLWSPGIDVPGVITTRPAWEPAGTLLSLASLSANANLAPDVCQVFLTWAAEETYNIFRGDLRELGDLMQRFNRRRDWLENVSGVSSTLFTIFADELIWSDNEEPGEPATRSRVAELRDVYSHVENFIGATLEVYVPTSPTEPGTKAKSVSQSGAPPSSDNGDDDPIEDVLTGQRLTLYRDLKTRTRRTSFDSLAKLTHCWRVDRPSDETIVTALKRLRKELNKISNCPVALVIEAKVRRTYLDK